MYMIREDQQDELAKWRAIALVATVMALVASVMLLVRSVSAARHAQVRDIRFTLRVESDRNSRPAKIADLVPPPETDVTGQ